MHLIYKKCESYQTSMFPYICRMGFVARGYHIATTKCIYKFVQISGISRSTLIGITIIEHLSLEKSEGRLWLLLFSQKVKEENAKMGHQMYFGGPSK